MRRAPRKVLPRNPRKLTLDKVDWSWRTADIAELMGLTPGRVSQLRKLFAPQTMKNVDRGKWDSVNWQKTNAEIAREMGVSRQAVWARRRAQTANPGDPQTATTDSQTNPNTL